MRRLVILAAAIVMILSGVQAMAQGSGLTEEEKLNKQVLEWVFAEGVNAQNLDAWDSVLAPEYVRHCDAMPPGMGLPFARTCHLFIRTSSSPRPRGMTSRWA